MMANPNERLSTVRYYCYCESIDVFSWVVRCAVSVVWDNDQVSVFISVTDGCMDDGIHTFVMYPSPNWSDSFVTNFHKSGGNPNAALS